MAEHVFAIKGDTIRALWSDEIADDLRALGRLTVERASHVEFRNDVQQWEVKLVSGEVLGLFKSRQEAVDHEITVLQERGFT